MENFPHRHGAAWEQSELHYLELWINDKLSFSEIAKKLKRTSLSVEIKARMLFPESLCNVTNSKEFVTWLDKQQQHIKDKFLFPKAPSMNLDISTEQVWIEECNKQSTENTKMFTSIKRINIATITFINGRRIDSYSQQEIMQLIYATEEDMKKYEALEHKPVLIKEAISTMNKELMELVTILDKHFP